MITNLTLVQDSKYFKKKFKKKSCKLSKKIGSTAGKWKKNIVSDPYMENKAMYIYHKKGHYFGIFNEGQVKMSGLFMFA